MLNYLHKSTDKDIFNKEVDQHTYYRLICTYLPNKLPSKDRVQLTKYFQKKVFNRTGIILDKKDKFLLDLIKYAKAYHTERKNNLKIDSTKQCALCGVSFEDGLPEIFCNRLDILNPSTYFSNRNRISEKCIDHIIPISKIGSNKIENLQYTCDLCNSAKSDICSILDKFELFSENVDIKNIDKFCKYEAGIIKETVNFYPLKLFYRVIDRHNKCSVCNESGKFMTTMPIDPETLYTFDNLVSICYDCLDQEDTIKEIRYFDL